MIENDRQRNITTMQISALRFQRKKLLKEKCPDDIHPMIYRAQIEATESLINELTDEIKEYDGAEIS
jgi:hypothetical protein